MVNVGWKGDTNEVGVASGKNIANEKKKGKKVDKEDGKDATGEFLRDFVVLSGYIFNSSSCRQVAFSCLSYSARVSEFRDAEEKSLLLFEAIMKSDSGSGRQLVLVQVLVVVIFMVFNKKGNSMTLVKKEDGDRRKERMEDGGKKRKRTEEEDETREENKGLLGSLPEFYHQMITIRLLFLPPNGLKR
jgi:hypothetical protein